MSDVVRIALNQTENGQIHWPKRCPRCGATESLVNVEARVGVQHKEGGFSVNPTTALLRMRTETTEFSFPVCKQHAFANELGIRILEKSLIPNLFRGSIYLALLRPSRGDSRAHATPTVRPARNVAPSATGQCLALANLDRGRRCEPQRRHGRWVSPPCGSACPRSSCCGWPSRARG